MQTFQLIIFRLSGLSEQAALNSASTLSPCKAICKLIIQQLRYVPKNSRRLKRIVELGYGITAGASPRRTVSLIVFLSTIPLRLSPSGRLKRISSNIKSFIVDIIIDILLKGLVILYDR